MPQPARTGSRAAGTVDRAGMCALGGGRLAGTLGNSTGRKSSWSGPAYAGRYCVAVLQLAASSAAPPWLAYAAVVVAGLSATAVVWNRLAERGKARQRYAERVAAWTGERTDCRLAGEWSHRWHELVVHNGGDQPVYDVVVTVPVPDSCELQEGEQPTAFFAVGLVAPGATATPEFGCRGQAAQQYATPLEAVFTDARGVRWKRDAAGRLRNGAPWRGRLRILPSALTGYRPLARRPSRPST